jgi:outer membrane protein TolC
MKAPLIALLICAAPVAAAMQAEEPLPLEQVLVQARTANARLPVAQQEVLSAEAREREASGELLPKLSIESDLLAAVGGSTYGGTGGFPGEDRLQVVARQPLYEGGELRARAAQALASVQSARAGYRAAEKDLDVDVRTLFAMWVEADVELNFRREGLERLNTYLLGIRARRAVGEGVMSDLLRAQARIAEEEANLAEVQRQLDDVRLQLNELMGRDPEAPLTLVAQEEQAPPVATADGWDNAPDIAQARAELVAAEAGITIALAGRRPHVAFEVDGGLFGDGLATGTAANFGHRLRSDFGASFLLVASWPVFDFGIYAGRLDEATALASQAERRVSLKSRHARLQWARAQTQLTNGYHLIEARRRAVPIARDTYVSAESLYRGGVGTALEVLDAYTSLIAASRADAQAVLAYRQAEALALRWGTP